jgi:hypothetical protein
MTKGEQSRLTACRLKVLQQAAHEQNVLQVGQRNNGPRRCISGRGRVERVGMAR